MAASGQLRSDGDVNLNVSTVGDVLSLGLDRTGEMILAHVVSLRHDVLDLRLRMDERLGSIELRLDDMEAASYVEGDVDDPEDSSREGTPAGGRRSLAAGEVGLGDHGGRSLRSPDRTPTARKRQPASDDKHESDYGNRESDHGSRESDYDNQESDYDRQESDYDNQGSDYDNQESDYVERKGSEGGDDGESLYF